MSPTPSFLARLLSARGALTIDALAREAGTSTSQILRQFEGLKDAGCEVDSHPQRGLRLISTGLGVWADYIEPRHAGRIGHRLTVYRQTSSTQDRARSIVAIGGESHDGHVIVADHQTGGRGRLGRRWFAPPGTALLLTAIVTQGQTPVDRLMLACCCAVARVIDDSTGQHSQVRWPNDVLIDGRKAAGTLIETASGYALIGIGINVSVRSDDLPVTDGDRPLLATSLDQHGRPVDRLILLDRLLDQLELAIRKEADETLREEWRRRSCLIQQRLTVESDGRRVTGRVVDIDPHHGLLVADDRGVHHTIPGATASLIL